MFLGFQDDATFLQAPDRSVALERARELGASVIRVFARWSQIAPARPGRQIDPADPAYRFEALDELVRGARARGIEVLITVYGTPAWANQGRGEHRVPRRYVLLRRFAQALATRYSGSFADLPQVRLFSVWNEPNTERFLAPQYSVRGRSVAPILYARLFRAAAAGIRTGNPQALVALGETSPRGLLRSRVGGRSHAPARFAHVLAQACGGACRFDAYAHHPHPTLLAARPLERLRWPNVAFANMSRFKRSLQQWFRLPAPPRMWFTEYGYQTDPPRRGGVTGFLQGRYLEKGVRQARQDPHVELFVWFVFRDHASARATDWERAGGIYDARFQAKPAVSRFRKLAPTVQRPF